MSRQVFGARDFEGADVGHVTDITFRGANCDKHQWLPRKPIAGMERSHKIGSRYELLPGAIDAGGSLACNVIGW